MFKKIFDKICEDHNLAGASLAVYNKGQLEEFNYGYRNIKTMEKVTSSTIYRIASISKIIVGMAIMKLFEEKKLDYTEDISKYLGYKVRNPYYPDDIITVQMVMTQTSSITDGPEETDEEVSSEDHKKGYNGVNGGSFFVSLKKLLTDSEYEYYSDKTFSNHRPGEYFEYSNFGAGILACIVEKITKMYFTDYVIETFFKPLNMDASFRPSQLAHPEKISNLYLFDYEKKSLKELRSAVSFIKNEYPFFSRGDNFRGPAGGLFVSISDLVKIMDVLMHDGKYNDIEILKKDTVDRMIEMHWAGNSFSDTYRAKGLQIKISDLSYPYILKGHTGGAYGLRSCLYFNKEDNLGLCFATSGGNFLGIDGKDDDLLTQIEKAVFEEYNTDPEEKTMVVDLYNNYVALNGRLITCEDRKLDDNEVFLPLYAVCEGLTIVPIFDEENVIFKKNNSEVKYDKDTKLFPLIKISKKLGYEAIVRNGQIVVNYH